jgi:hypothetical protein
MLIRRWRRRLPGVFFWLCLGCAVVLLALVLVGPPLDSRSEFVPDGARPVVRLFAQDATVRQTAIASALGLVVTAFAFFRGPYLRPPRAPTDVIGA